MSRISGSFPGQQSSGPMPWPINPLKDTALFSAQGSGSSSRPSGASPAPQTPNFAGPSGQGLLQPGQQGQDGKFIPSPATSDQSNSQSFNQTCQSEPGLIAQQIRAQNSRLGANASGMSADASGLGLLDASGAQVGGSPSRSPALSLQVPAEISTMDKYSVRSGGSPMRTGSVLQPEPLTPTSSGAARCWPWGKKKRGLLPQESCHQCKANLQVAHETRNELQTLVQRLGAVEQGLGRLELTCMSNRKSDDSRMQHVEGVVTGSESRLQAIEATLNRLEQSIGEWGLPSTLLKKLVDQSLQQWTEAERQERQNRAALKSSTFDQFAQTSPKPTPQQQDTSAGKPPAGQSLRMLKLQSISPKSPRKAQPTSSDKDPLVNGDPGSRTATPRVVKYDVCRHCGYRGSQQRVQQAGSHHNKGCSLAMVPEPLLQSSSQTEIDEPTFGVDHMELVTKSSEDAQLFTIEGVEVHGEIPGLQADSTRNETNTSESPGSDGIPDPSPARNNKTPSPVSVRQLGESSIVSASSPHRPLDMSSRTPVPASKANQELAQTDILCPPPVATRHSQKPGSVSTEAVPTPTAEKSRVGTAQVSSFGSSGAVKVPLSTSKQVNVQSPEQSSMMGLFSEEEMAQALAMANAPEPPTDLQSYQYVNMGYGDENSNPRNYVPHVDQRAGEFHSDATLVHKYGQSSSSGWQSFQQPATPKDLALQIPPTGGRYGFHPSYQDYSNARQGVSSNPYTHSVYSGNTHQVFQAQNGFDQRSMPMDSASSANSFAQYNQQLSRAEELLAAPYGFYASGQYAM